MNLKSFYKKSISLVLWLLFFSQCHQIYLQQNTVNPKNNFFEFANLFKEPDNNPEIHDIITNEIHKLFYKDYHIVSQRVSANGSLETYPKVINELPSESKLKSKLHGEFWTFLAQVEYHPLLVVELKTTDVYWVNEVNVDGS